MPRAAPEGRAPPFVPRAGGYRAHATADSTKHALSITKEATTRAEPIRLPGAFMTEDDVEIIEKTTPFKGYFQVDRYRLRHRLFDGGWSDSMTREVFERSHATAVLPYDADLDTLVLIEQFRSGAHAALQSPLCAGYHGSWLVECVAGIIEEGETPEDVAYREMIEETGCRLTDLVSVCRYLVSPGGSSETVFVFCGRVDASNAGGIHGLVHEQEDLRVFTVAPEDAFALLDSGAIVNAMTIIALQWFRANHAQLRQRWRNPAGS